MKVKSESKVAQSCPTLSDPMDCSLPGSSIHGISQARVVEWVAISFSRRSSQPRDWTQVSHIVGRLFTIWATREVRKGRGTRDQIANICWIIEKARVPEKNIYFCFIDYAKAFDCVDHDKLWNILKQMGIPDHLTCLLRNLYAGQEATVRTGHGTRVVPDQERSMSRLYIVTLLI